MLKWIKELFQSAEEVAPVVVQKREVKPKDISTPVLEIGAAFLNNPKRFKMKHDMNQGEAYAMFREIIYMIRHNRRPERLTQLVVKDIRTGLEMTFQGTVALRSPHGDGMSFVNKPLSALVELVDATVTQYENPMWMTKDEAQYLVKLFVDNLVAREAKIHARELEQEAKQAKKSQERYEKRIAVERERITKLYKED